VRGHEIDDLRLNASAATVSRLVPVLSHHTRMRPPDFFQASGTETKGITQLYPAPRGEKGPGGWGSGLLAGVFRRGTPGGRLNAHNALRRSEDYVAPAAPIGPAVRAYPHRNRPPGQPQVAVFGNARLQSPMP